MIRRHPADHDHFKAPRVLPYFGAVLCAFLAGPWARDIEQREQYTIGAYLLVIGVVLWIIAYLTTRNSTDKTVDRDLKHARGVAPERRRPSTRKPANRRRRRRARTIER